MNTHIIALEQAVVELSATISPTKEDPNAKDPSTLLDNVVALA